ncbi:MAG: hypothetical protein AAB797_03005, partial [Patescibacteria group bacterium]
GIFPFLTYMYDNIFQVLALDFYYIYSVDTLSHLLGGLAIAYSANYALSLMERKKWITIQKNILRAGIIVSTVMTIAVLWEFYEFIYDIYLLGPTAQPSVADTIKDLCLGMLGAVIFSYLFVYLKLGKRAD